MAELRTSPAKAKPVAACRVWLRKVRTGPVLFFQQRIFGPSTSFVGQLGFDQAAPALVDYCDGCGRWSPSRLHALHNCARGGRGWYKRLGRALLAELEARARG